MMLANKSLHAAVHHTLQFSLNVNEFLCQLARFVYLLMYGKYTLFYESPKNWGYYVHAQTVCTRPLLGGGGAWERGYLVLQGRTHLNCMT